MIVAATLDVYKEAMSSLLPTPAKSHYVFNLRDFARVVLGCLLVKTPSIDNKKQFIRLWVHEVYRVYYDRLVDGNDRQWLFELMQKMVKQHFKDDFQTIFKHLSSGSKVTDDNMRSLLYGDYMKPDAVSVDICTTDNFFPSNESKRRILPGKNISEKQNVPIIFIWCV